MNRQSAIIAVNEAKSVEFVHEMTDPRPGLCLSSQDPTLQA
jgi:hypothetical protein